ncbi:pentatricopeptide repeat-containing protein At4g32430, mitochondrial-like [Typha angustifolia]|uniref:pentatricopeptide repeat-containing protein At4g32430, mitochondrial-like n=1 Tax=Typha angustifolia TaxID=59011 RepID=UPI003C30A144
MRRLRVPTRLPANSHFKTLFSQTADQLLDEVPQRALWPVANIIVASSPLKTIRDHLRFDIPLNPATISTAITSCLTSQSITQLHAYVVSSGFDSYTFISNSLMTVYSKTGSFYIAHKLFDDLPNRDVVSWNTILSGFADAIHALEFVSMMARAGVPFDAVTLTTSLAFAADIRDVEFGQQLHSVILRCGFCVDTFVMNALITTYARSEFLDEAERVFDEMVFKDLVSWNALICGLTQEGNHELEAIQLFLKMVREEGMRPDRISFASVIPACGHKGLIRLGCQIHCFAEKVGLAAHVSLSNVLISMYYKCGNLGSAGTVFKTTKERNVVSWTTIISMDPDNAISLFNDMRLDGVQPNDVTFVALIFAVTSDHLLREGQMIHGVCVKTGILAEVNVSNSLITMYAKLQCVKDSRRIFDGMVYKEIVTWNSLVSGYAQNQLCKEALEIFSSLILHLKPNQYTFGSILSSITTAETVSLTYGQTCHCCIVKLGLNTDEYVSGALIDMYAKRGSIDESQKAFEETVQRSLISWTAIISAHAKHGNYETVMSLFDNMVSSGITPDSVALLAVLVACGCKGMVDKGQDIFNSMMLERRVDLWPEHYACLVDMLGRAGRLVEAEELLKQIPTGPGISALQSLLGSCRVHGNVEMGKRVADLLMEMEPAESGTYVLISNIYAEKGEWEHVAKIRKGMRERGVKKEVGFSWVDAGIRDSIHMHKFSSDDMTHPLAKEIYSVANSVGLEMKLLDSDIEMEVSASFAC